jgi:hypothetical protein
VLKESLTVFADYRGVVITRIVRGESIAWKTRMTLRLKGYNRIARNISGSPETFRAYQYGFWFINESMK